MRVFLQLITNKSNDAFPLRVNCPGLLTGPGQVSVWKEQDLLQGWSGGLHGKAAFGQAALGLCPHPEDHPLLAGPQEVSEDEAECHHRTEIRPGSSGTKVSGGNGSGGIPYITVCGFLMYRVVFSLSATSTCCEEPEPPSSFRSMFACGLPGDASSSSALQLSPFSAS